MTNRIFASVAAAFMAAGIGSGVFFATQEAEAVTPACTASQWNYYKCVSGKCQRAWQSCYCSDTDPNRNKTISSGCSNGNPFCTAFGTQCKIAYCGDAFCEDPEG